MDPTFWQRIIAEEAMFGCVEQKRKGRRTALTATISRAVRIILSIFKSSPHTGYLPLDSSYKIGSPVTP